MAYFAFLAYREIMLLDYMCRRREDMKIRKILTAAMLAVMTLSFAACGNDERK